MMKLTLFPEAKPEPVPVIAPPLAMVVVVAVVVEAAPANGRIPYFEQRSTNSWE